MKKITYIIIIEKLNWKQIKILQKNIKTKRKT
jgi:hypothetical protein